MNASSRIRVHARERAGGDGRVLHVPARREVTVIPVDRRVPCCGAVECLDGEAAEHFDVAHHQVQLVTGGRLEGPVHGLIGVDVDGDARLALDGGFLAGRVEGVCCELIESGDDGLGLVVTEVLQLDSGRAERLRGRQDALGNVGGGCAEEQLVAFTALVVGAVVLHPCICFDAVGGVGVVAGTVADSPVVVGLVRRLTVILAILRDDLVDARGRGGDDGLDTAILLSVHLVPVAGRRDGDQVDLTDRIRLRGGWVVPVEGQALANEDLVGPHATKDRVIARVHCLDVPRELVVARVPVVMVDIRVVSDLVDAVSGGVGGRHAAHPRGHIDRVTVPVKDVGGLTALEVVPQVLALFDVYVEYVGRKRWHVHGW